MQRARVGRVQGAQQRVGILVHAVPTSRLVTHPTVQGAVRFTVNPDGPCPVVPDGGGDDAPPVRARSPVGR
ncbi:hypothetical protein CBZ_01770 [Cellulomonas biazotea]|uniref:Uncharacterized protein n=1 Tax=Cellulomonas biazotea TaxID=1709 RepID=A0A402DLX1_9CELL|nr:hypothetical protein CBZ_01770 [Cellulomonas biazotea]